MPPQSVNLIYSGISRNVPFKVLENSEFFKAIYHSDVLSMSGADIDTDIQDHVIPDTFSERVVTHAIDVMMFTFEHQKNPTPTDIPELPTNLLEQFLLFATTYDL